MSKWLGPILSTAPQDGSDDSAPADTTPLCDLLNAVLGTEDKTEWASLIAAFMEDESAIGSVAAALGSSSAPVVAILTRLGAPRGMKGHADNLRRLLSQTLKEQRAAAKECELERALATRAASGPDLAATLDHDKLPPGLRCPPGWDMGPRHLRQVVYDDKGGETTADVAPRPILITARLKEVADGSTSLRLEWPTQQGWKHKVVPRGTVMDARSLVSMAAFDAPVHSDNMSKMVRFLAEFEAYNADVLPETRVSSVMGWQGPKYDTFLWGRNLLRAGSAEDGQAVEGLDSTSLTPGDLYFLADEGASELADAFRLAGTWEGWLGAAKAAEPYASAWLSLYAAVVPPVMPFLPTLKNFVLDISGETSRGKTTSLRLAGSAWGSPDERAGGVVRTWDSTRVWRERAAGALGHLPLMLDDTKRARRREDVGQFIYDVASGSGRGRGTTTGMRDTVRYHTVLISTGEAPITSFTTDGGTSARTLCLWGSPFGGADAATVAAVDKINRVVLEHHGHLGPRVVQWLIEDPEASTFVRAAYAAASDRWAAKASGNPVATRAAQYIAALEVAGRIVHERMKVPAPTSSPLEHAWDAVRSASTEADRASDALREVLSWAVRHQERFFGRAEARDDNPEPKPGGCHSRHIQEPPAAGWLGAWQAGDGWTRLAILSKDLREVLQRQDYDSEAILRTWNDRGWLLTESGRHTRKVTVGLRKGRCVVVTRTACELVEDAGTRTDT